MLYRKKCPMIDVMPLNTLGQRVQRTLSKPVFIMAIFSILALCSCATTSDFENLRSETSILKAEAINQKREIAQLKEQLSVVSKDTTSFSAVLESQSSLLKQSLDFSKELQTLRGQFDENKYHVDRKIRELINERDVQQTRIVQLENELREVRTKTGITTGDKRTEEPSAPSARKSEGGSPEKGAEDAGDKATPQQLYDSAHMDFKEKRYAEARQKFDTFIREFPKNPLVPNSYYWIGESYYAEKKYEDAILSYETVIKKYSNDNKVKAAMLKQGFAFIELGDKKTGKVILERLIEKYPRSAEAEMAEKKIAEILSKGTTQSKTKPQKKK